ncbi:MAG: N(4)-(beta-N-acetylglucosaminyl)-L-asparaginase [Ignavibacteria bacterium]|nr:N(4)-(beta-N-acetylglucosaminyl)-L-asparaginase [Ignavibacteria bacterium]
MKKVNRRKFITNAAVAGAGIALIGNETFASSKHSFSGKVEKPVVITTWDRGHEPNIKAWEILAKGGNSLDAVEAGVRVAEDDPNNMSVGYGGLPDETGVVTLDASIMDWRGRAGAVGYIQNIRNPISVARKVMEKTRHIMLAGEGAKRFALANGFKTENLLTEASLKRWNQLKEKGAETDFRRLEENHDTITMLAIDNNGNLSGACTTSGLAWKIHGRVGDSPIIGAGLYLDNDVGAAGGTGIGEAIWRSLASFLIVEKMRDGMSPQEACVFAVKRVIKVSKQYLTDIGQAAFIAMNSKGETGAYSVRTGFDYMLTKNGETKGIKASFELK